MGFTHEETLKFMKDGCWNANGGRRNSWGNCNGVQCVPLTNPSNVPFDEINAMALSKLLESISRAWMPY